MGFPGRGEMSTPPLHRLTLCADDFGQHPAIDAGIIELAGRGVLHAVSCMSGAPGWKSAAPMLRALAAQPELRIDLGLHFNLTEGFGLEGEPMPAGGAASIAPAAPRGLGALIAAACLGRLGGAERARLRAALSAQLDAFADAVGVLPTMLDGHQHVHQLPVVREVFLEVIAERYAGRARPWLRNTVPPAGLGGFKPQVLAVLGGRVFRRRLLAEGLDTNRGFLGVYGFDAPDEAAYGAWMERWLALAPDGALLMCHPASAEVPEDAIGRQRPVEFRYLASEAFARALRGIVLGPMPRA